MGQRPDHQSRAQINSQCTMHMAAVPIVAAPIVAQPLQATFKFEAGKPQTVKVSDEKRVVKEEIMDVIALISGVLRADATEGCSGEVNVGALVGKHRAECEVEVVADAIETEIDATAEQGAVLVPCGCTLDLLCGILQLI